MSERKLGAILAYVLMVVGTVTAFFYTPFLVHKLGQSQFGVYNIVGSLAAYFSLLDLGLSDTVVRYVVRHRRNDDRAGLAAFMGAMLTIYGCICLALCILGAGIYIALPHLFGAKLTAEELVLLKEMFLVVLAGGAVSILCNPFSGVLLAHEKFILSRSLDIAQLILVTLIAMAVLLMGFEAVAVVVVTAACSVAVSLFKAVYALARLHVGVRFTAMSPKFLREIASYAAPIFIVVVAELIYWRLDNIVIGSMIGAAAVAVYAVAVSFQKHFLRLATAISRVMYPLIVHIIEGGADRAELTAMMVRVSRVQAVILLPALTGMLLFGRDFLHLWLGPTYEAAYPVMVITLVPYTFEVIGNVRNMVLQVKNLYWIRAAMILAVSLLNVALSIALIPVLGIYGSAVGTGAGLVIGLIGTTAVLHLKGGVDAPRMFREMGRGLLPATLLAMAAGAALNFVPLTGWGWFFARAGIYVAIYAGLVWLIGMNPSERSQARGVLRLRFA